MREFATNGLDRSMARMLLGHAPCVVGEIIEDPVKHRVQFLVRTSRSEFAGYLEHRRVSFLLRGGSDHRSLSPRHKKALSVGNRPTGEKLSRAHVTPPFPWNLTIQPPERDLLSFIPHADILYV